MTTFLNTIGCIGALAVLGLAVFGIYALVLEATGQADERRRIAERTRHAEQQIMDIGHQAQAAIMQEALRRTYRGAHRPGSGASRPDGTARSQ